METLDRLFSEARSEAPETKLSEVQKWIVPLTIGALIVAFFAKLKVIVTLKPFIMLSSAIVAVGIGTGVVLTLNTASEDNKQNLAQNNKIEVYQGKQDPKPNEIALQADSAAPQKQVVDGEQQPVLQMIEDLNSDYIPLPSMQYCMSLPVAPVQPFNKLQPVKPITMLSEITEISSFNELKVWGAVDIVLLQGEKESVRIEGEGSDNSPIKIENRGQTLEVHSECDDKKKNCEYDLTIYLTCVNLKKINCSGASSIKTEGNVNLANLSIDVSGATDLDLNMDVNKLKLCSSGASEIQLDGTMQDVDIKADGASKFLAEKCTMQNVKLECSGASIAKFRVEHTLEVKASGASDVFYSGNPNKVTEDVSGVAVVKHSK